MAIAQETIDALKDKHRGRKLHYRSYTETTTGLAAEVVIREPSREEWRRYSDMAQDDQRSVGLDEKMVSDLVVWPERAEFDKLLDDKPGLVTKIAAEISTIAGTGRAVQVEKKVL